MTGWEVWTEGKTYRRVEDNYNIYQSTSLPSTSTHTAGTSQFGDNLGKKYVTGMEHQTTV